MTERTHRQKPRTSRLLVAIETILTSGIISVPFMTILYEKEIGLNHEQIAITQAAFTLVAMLLNIPLGWVADRYSRKGANIVGDLCCFLGLILYSRAQTMFDCILCETFFGVGIAASQGVDSTLLQHFADKEDPSNDSALYKDCSAKVSSICQLMCLVFYLIGFAIGDMNVRDIILISSIPFIPAIIASCFIKDDSEKLKKSGESPFKSMKKIAKKSIKNPETNIRIAAYIISREITHGIIWCFTPILQRLGVDGKWIVLGWAANSFAAFIGTKLARKFRTNLPEWICLLIPVTAVSLAAFVMSRGITAFTLGLYVFFGMTQGWTSVIMMPNLKVHAPKEKGVTIESFAKTCSQAYYIVSVWIIGRAADIKLEYAPLAIILLFAPLAIPVVIRLKHQERHEKTHPKNPSKEEADCVDTEAEANAEEPKILEVTFDD